MREETNNEIDLLLRRVSRRQEVHSPDADPRIDSDHLDADELSAYAENALPAAARTRYTEHLAECSKCREFIVQLSPSVSVGAAKETMKSAEPSALRKLLASFFSPMVLRYAVPALGLIVVAAIGFVMLRSNQRGTSVAQLEPQASRAPVANTQPPTSGYFDSQDQIGSQPPAGARSSIERSRDIAKQAPAPGASPARGVTEAPKIEAPEPKSDDQAAANVAARPASAPAATVAEMRVDVERRKSGEQSREAPAGELAKQKTVEAQRDRQSKSEDARAASPPKGQTATAAAPQSESTGTFSVADREKDRDNGAVRNVAGRRFRKQSGVWVDTAYNSGSAVVNVARGSEQFRALVADEPSIKTIADQLDGPIIVVWKGSTYRIR